MKKFITILKNNPLFRGLKEEDIGAVLKEAGARTKKVKTQGYILRVGDTTSSFSIAFNRQQLADYLCLERAAMSVELSKLQKEGVLRYDKNRFELMEVVDV